MIDLVDVTKVFGTGPGAVTALDGVTVHVAPGEILGVIGTRACRWACCCS